MKIAVVRLALSCWFLSALLSISHATDRVGVVLPLEGRFEAASALILKGVQQAISDAKADVELVTVSDTCDVTKVDTIAKSLSGVRFVIGPLCFEPSTALAKTLNQDSSKPVPVLAIGPRSPLLARARKLENLPLFVLGKDANAEADAVLNEIIPRFGGRPFAIVDDGSVHGRSLTDAIRLIGEERGIKPTTVATFRPFQSTQKAMLQRLARSGVEAMFIAGAPEDVVTIANDLKALKRNWLLAVGEQAALLPYSEAASDLPDSLLFLRELPARTDIASNLLPPERAQLARGLVAGEVALSVLSGQRLMPNASFVTSLGNVTVSKDGRLSILPLRAVTWDVVRGDHVLEN